MILVALLAITPCAPALNAQTPRCNVGANPVNSSRQPTADEEIVNNPADRAISYGSGSSGHPDVYCVLQAGVPVVINKDTGVAKWVYGCGNPIRTMWFPKRVPTPALSQTEAPQLKQPVVTYSSSSTTNINFNQVAREEQIRQEDLRQPDYYTAPVEHHWGRNAAIGGGIVGVVVVVVKFCGAGKKNGNSGGYVGTGGAQ